MDYQGPFPLGCGLMTKGFTHAHDVPQGPLGGSFLAGCLGEGGVVGMDCGEERSLLALFSLAESSEPKHYAEFQRHFFARKL